jgi:hypothetical protein
VEKVHQFNEFEEEFNVKIVTREENTLDIKSCATFVQNTVGNYCRKFHKLPDRVYFSDITIS